MNGMSELVKSVARLTLAPIFVFGTYLALHNDLSHGAGFAGGVVIALGLVLLLFAFGRKETLRKLVRSRATFLKDLGLLALCGFTSAALYGGSAWATGEPLETFGPAMVVLANISLCMAAAGFLFSIFLNLVAGAHASRPGKREDGL